MPARSIFNAFHQSSRFSSRAVPDSSWSNTMPPFFNSELWQPTQNSNRIGSISFWNWVVPFGSAAIALGHQAALASNAAKDVKKAKGKAGLVIAYFFWLRFAEAGTCKRFEIITRAGRIR